MPEMQRKNSACAGYSVCFCKMSEMRRIYAKGLVKMDAASQNTITRSKEDYLRVIYELSRSNKTIRSSDIAERLGVTRASVSKMMSELKRFGLIEKEKYGNVILTENGYKLAAQIKNRHDLIVTFLVDVLGVNAALANRDACKMEHALSPETAERLSNRISELHLKNKNKTRERW